ARDLRIAGEGLEFIVFAAATDAFGEVAIKVPRERVFENDNDPSVRASSLLEQEALLAGYARSQGLPAPAIHAVMIGEGELDFLVMEHMAHDGTPPAPRAHGELAREIHDLPLLDARLVAHEFASFERTIAERLGRRARILERLSGERIPYSGEKALAALAQ